MTIAPTTTGPLVAPLPGTDPPGHLTTGWEAHRPLDDGLVRRFVHAYASSFTGPVHHLGGRVVRRDAHVVWDRGRPASLFNGAMLLQPVADGGWQPTMDALEADLGLDPGDGRSDDLGGATGEVTLFSPWPTPDLSARGWQLVGHPPLLLFHGRPEPEPATPGWLEIREVTDASTLADWEHVAIVGYPLDDVDHRTPGTLLDDRVLADPAFRAWVAYADGVAIGIGTSYLVHGVNVFVLGVTLPSHRGRGVWEALARRRLVTASRFPAMALFSDFSRSPAQRLGFVPLARWTLWSRQRAIRP